MHRLVKFPIYFLSNAKIIFIRGGILLWVQHDCIKVGTDPLYNLGSGSAPAAASLDLRNTNVGAARHSSRDSRTIHSPSLHLGNSSSRVNIFAIIPLQERILGFTIGSQLWIQNLWILDPRKTISGVGAVALRCKGVWRSVRLNILALAALQDVTESLVELETQHVTRELDPQEVFKSA